MKRFHSLFWVVLVVGSLVLAACGGGTTPEASAEEETYPQPPAEYASMTNPMAGNADAIAAGKTIYESDCASCHGDKGLGDGPAGASLSPHPGNLQEAAAKASNGYLFWRVSEGGMMAPFNSAMPAWKDVLSQNEIWQVISYIETLK